MLSLVFDIGGTRTRAGLSDSQTATLICSAGAPTPNHLILPECSFDELCERLLDQIFRLGAEIGGRRRVHAVHVGFAGPVDDFGRVLAAPTLWGTRLSRPYPLAENIAARWPGTRISVLNDVTAAGYRYLRSAEEDFCIVTVSSGIGNKVFVNGRPLLGSRGRGGELGHLVVDRSPDAPRCECGGRGHLGAVASGLGALEIARTLAPDFAKRLLTSPALAAAFRQRTPWAVAAIERAAMPLGWGLAAVHASIGTERFILIGGFALALGPAYRERVAGAAAACCWGNPEEWDSRVELGLDDDFSGLIGAGIFGSLKEPVAA